MKRIVLALSLLCLSFVVPARAQDTEALSTDLAQQVAAMETADLQAEAARLQPAVEEAQKSVEDVEARLGEAAEETKPEIEAELAAAEGRAEELLARLQLVVDELANRDVDVTDLKVFLTMTTGEVSLENMDAGVALSLVDEWIQVGRDWVVQRGPGVIFKGFLFLLIVFAFWILSKIVAKLTRRALGFSKLKTSDLLKDFTIKIAARATFILGVLVGISSVGIEIGPVLAGLGIAGFVLGFALQETLANFASGLMILLYRPFDVGDLVEVAGVSGTVMAMTTVSTTIKTLDNQLLIVPNGQIWGNVIKNVTAMPERRVDLVVGISYEDDIDKAQEVMLDEMKKHPLVLDSPEPIARLYNMNESSLDFVVRPWCKTQDYWEVYWDVTKLIKQRFDKEGISVPFPQRDVHMIPQPQPQNGGGDVAVFERGAKPPQRTES